MSFDTQSPRRLGLAPRALEPVTQIAEEVAPALLDLAGLVGRAVAFVARLVPQGRSFHDARAQTRFDRDLQRERIAASSQRIGPL